MTLCKNTDDSTFRNVDVDVLLNTLEHERHTLGALLVAFANELRAAMTDRTPESTRDLLGRAERGEMRESEYPVLLNELRALTTRK